MTKRFEKKVVLTTGTGSGIGRAAAIAFAKEGAKVVISCRGTETGEETVRLIREAGGEAIYVKCDVSQTADVKALIDVTVSTYGGIDVALNNAGVISLPNKTAEISEEEWDRVMGINLKGVWLCMKYEIPHMIGRKGAAIVNTSSVGGVRGVPNVAAYTASKHGVIGLTRTAALDYASEGIRINAVCPGITAAGMANALEDKPEVKRKLISGIPMGRMGLVDELADAILWMSCEGAGFVTGQALVVDGGQTIH